MKKIFALLVIVLPGIFNTSFSQIPNSNFDNWHADSLGRVDPDLWDCSNILWGDSSVVQAIGKTGTGLSVKLKCVTNPDGPIPKGGSITLDHYGYTGSVRPSALRGFWKSYNPTANSELIVHIYLYDGNNYLIGSAVTTTPISTSVTNWTAFTLILSYSSFAPVESYTLDISWSPGSSSAISSYGFIDDLYFDLGTGVEEAAIPGITYALHQLGDYGRYQLFIDPKNSGKMNIDVLDITGKEVQSLSGEVNASGGGNFLIDLSSFPKGIYVCRMKGEKTQKAFKLILQ